MIDRAEPAPLEELAQLEHPADRVERDLVAVLGDDAAVLVLDWTRPSASCLSTIQMLCRMSSGSKPATTIGRR